MHTIILVNLILCVIIVVLGCVGFKKAKEKWPLYIAISFGLFGVTHLLTLLDLKATLEAFITAIGTIAFLLVIYTVSRVAFKK